MAEKHARRPKLCEACMHRNLKLMAYVMTTVAPAWFRPWGSAQSYSFSTIHRSSMIAHEEFNEE